MTSVPFTLGRFSANYDPHTRSGGNPPNSAYHMNLQQARCSLSAGFAARLEGRGGANKGLGAGFQI
jgi:hypothetical protein